MKDQELFYNACLVKVKRIYLLIPFFFEFSETEYLTHEVKLTI